MKFFLIFFFKIFILFFNFEFEVIIFYKFSNLITFIYMSKFNIFKKLINYGLLLKKH